MYGTIARLHLKPGMEDRFMEALQEYEDLDIPGFIAEHVFRMDDNPNEFYMIVLFEDRRSYKENAESTEQDRRYRKMRDMLTKDPEWHDGEIVFTATMQPEMLR